MKTVHEISGVRDIIRNWRRDGESLAVILTMGNLHKGHMSLVSLAHEHAEKVAVSIFVNPAQFGQNEDYENYPRTLANDKRRLSRAGVDLLFVPDVEEIYPETRENRTGVVVPGLSEILCGETRTDHFEGVTSVVSRLFNILQPDVAVFGQKDYQQLAVVRRMVADLHMGIEVIAGQTSREKDGLAMSSRNQYLSEDERAVASGLFLALKICRESLVSGSTDFAALEKEGHASLQRAGFKPDYFSIRQARDLSKPEPDSRYLVILTAAWLGKARLIDNVLVEL